VHARLTACDGKAREAPDAGGDAVIPGDAYFRSVIAGGPHWGGSAIDSVPAGDPVDPYHLSYATWGSAEVPK
jgi:hypothetical protein